MNLLKQFIIKELLQFKRDKRMFLVVMIAPIVQLTLLGYAANIDVTNINLMIMDNDRSAMSRELVNKLEAAEYFNIIGYTFSYKEIDEELKIGELSAALVIPENFEKSIVRKEPVKVQAIFEGSDANKSTIALGYLQGTINKYSQNIMVSTVERTGGQMRTGGNIIPQPRVWYNPEMKTRNFMVPGIMSLILMITTITLMSMAIVKEKEIGTLEQLIVTPIKSYQLIIGKLLPFVFIGIIVMSVVMSVMTFWFEIPIRGNVLFLFIATMIFILSNLGIGLFVSTVSKTQQQAMLTSSFGLMMPMIFLSGFTFPLENMPKIFQYVSYSIPLTYYMEILRGVVLKGIGFSDLWEETLILLSMGIFIMFLSILRFNKKID